MNDYTKIYYTLTLLAIYEIFDYLKLKLFPDVLDNVSKSL